ncbi:EF-hand domain-containing protein [Sphingobium sp.]|uniref:EF-hand domain-containing protein n=1 Tax=Sphingobium sp. TaxID=1912891 RepID=UPI0035C6B428
MGRIFAGAVAALFLAAGGLFWWQGRASNETVPQPLIGAPPPPAIENLPEGDPDAVGEAPPMPGEASSQSREQKRFGRYDRNRDGVITRIEMMGSRVKAFKALDRNNDNLLSFEEWAVTTSDRFATADANGDGKLTPAEFATTAPKRAAAPRCKC